MAKYKGVTQASDGSWVYRLKMKLPDGSTFDTRIKKGPDGSIFKTARAAADAMAEHKLRLLAAPVEEEPPKKSVTLGDVYANYLINGTSGKAPATLRKQDSMWKNHIGPKFGNVPVADITLVDMNAFLSDLYNKQGKAYSYVEGFLKFFYLLFGHADRMEVIDQSRYVRMFVSSGTRLSMPKPDQEDALEMEKQPTYFTDRQLVKIGRIFTSEDGNLLTAYYLGLYCGLRISECFAVRWKNIELGEKSGVLTVERQMVNEGGVFKLTAVKTLTSVRKVIIPEFLNNYLSTLKYKQMVLAKNGPSYRNFDRVYDEVTDQWIVSGDFVNRKSNGELLTVNSMKYWTKKVKAELGIDFHYHCLRHTYATNCALRNVNLQMLMSMMGHKKIETTQKYYISTDNELFREKTLQLLNTMYDFTGLPPETEPLDPKIAVVYSGTTRTYFEAPGQVVATAEEEEMRQKQIHDLNEKALLEDYDNPDTDFYRLLEYTREQNPTPAARTDDVNTARLQENIERFITARGLSGTAEGEALAKELYEGVLQWDEKMKAVNTNGLDNNPN